MIRATTGGVLKSYRNNLMNSFISMNKARDTVLSQRNFNSYAEDPAAAAKAFRLRKSRMTVDSQHDICNDTLKKYQAGYSCLQSIDEVLDTQGAIDGSFMNTLHGATLTWLNDPTGDAREQLTKALDQMSESLIQTMNQKYGDDFIFAGADGHNVPFQIKENKLYYRGVPVDASVPEIQMAKDNATPPANTPLTLNENGEYATGLDADKTYYLKSDEVSVISQDEYNRLYVVPTVNSGTDGPIEYNADGTPRGDGGYYQKTDGTGWISIADYDAAATKPSIFLDSANQPIEYNADGTERGEGGYYIDVTDPNNMKPISIADYNAVVARSQDAPTIVQDAAGVNLSVDENGVPTAGGTSYLIVNGDPKEQLVAKEAYDTAASDVEKLKYLANEKYFVDIGLGFQEDENGKLIESSGFNAALNGINFLGYGLDADGDPKNLYSLVQKMKEVSDSVSEDDKWTPEIYDEFHRLVKKFETGCSNFKTEFTNMAAGTDKLEINEKLLSDNFYSLQEQYADLEDVDMVDSITSFIWAEYCYNAALKVGNNVLSESLMDYLT